MKLGISPFKFGLLGGLGGFMQGIGSYFDANRKLQAQLEAYRAKSGYDTSLAQLKAQNDRLLAAMKIEAEQRTYTNKTTDANGKPIEITYRNVLKPDGSGYQPAEIGRVGLADTFAPKGMQVRNVRKGTDDVTEQFDPNTGDTKVIGQGPHFKPSDPNEETAAERRNKLQQTAENKREAARLVASDMKEYNKSDDKDKLLEAAGIPATIPDPDAKTLVGNPDPSATKPNPDAAKLYRQAKQKEYEDQLGIGAASDNSSTDAPQGFTGPDGTFYPNGAHLQDGKGRNLIIKDGNAVPLAMDQVEADQSTAQAAPSEDDDETPQGSPLLAASDEEDAQDTSEPDDGEDDTQGQGLLNGRYA